MLGLILLIMLAAGVIWAVDRFGVPDPFNWLIKILAAIFALFQVYHIAVLLL